MPSIDSLRQTFKVNLISVPDVEIEMFTSVIYAEEQEINALETNEEKGIMRLVKSIKSWNLVNEKNEPLPISKENLLRLPSSEVAYLLSVILDNIKKNSEKILKTFSGHSQAVGESTKA